MPIPSFPTNIPKVFMGQYSYKADNNVVRTEMESGLARQRRRSIFKTVKFNVKWIFSRSELAIFEKFYSEEIYDGAGWFNIKLVNGTGESEYKARFVADSVETQTVANEHVWEVTGVLETVGMPILP